MAAAIPYLIIASSVVSAASAVSSADASAENARGQANIAATQATIARQTSDNALALGNANEEQQRRQSALLLGQKRAGLLSAGIGAEGSASDVYGQAVGNETLKALNARYDGQLKSWSALNQAGLDDMQGVLALNKASADETAGMFGAATSLLGGASKMSKWKQGAGSSDDVLDASVSSTYLPPATVVT